MELFWPVFGLGMAFFAAPGPVNIETLRRGVSRGYWSALGVQIGALCAELVLSIVVLFGLAPLMQQRAVQLALAIVAASFLFWIAWQALRDLRRQTVVPAHDQPSTRSTFVGAMYAGSNPLTVTIWLGVASVLATANIDQIRPIHIVIVGGAYMTGALSWAVPFAAIAAGSRHLIRPNVWRWWNALSGLAIGGYGVQVLWAALPR